MSKATDMLTTMGGLRGPAAAPKGASHGADDMNATVGLLRAMATGSEYRERKHDIILTAGADEIERLRAIRAGQAKTIEVLRDELNKRRAQRDELRAALEELVFAALEIERLRAIRVGQAKTIEVLRDELNKRRAQRDELLAALEELVFAYNEDSSAIRQANAAIKKAKEQP